MSNTPDLQFALLRDRPGIIPRVAGWWCREWGLPDRHTCFDDYVAELAAPAGPDGFPFHLVAFDEDATVGVATLKNWNMLQDRFPESRCWLTGVYVLPAARGKGIATALCRELLGIAGSRSIDRVYLQTEALDGGLYARLGFTPLQQICVDSVDVLVMTCSVSVLLP